MIKFFNLKRQDKKNFKKIFSEFKKIFNKGDFVNGEIVNRFENDFKKISGTKYVISVANGTDALIISLKSLNLKLGDEIILPAMTWKSTLLAVTNHGLKPVLADIQKDSSNYCLKSLASKITKKTKVIILVHLYGNPCETKKINKIIKGKKIKLLEDAAQAHGSFDYDLNKRIGSIGNIACFSFYPGKNLGAYGDGGCITTNSKTLYDKIYKIKNMGSFNKFDCEVNATNSRLDTLQAAVLKIKLKDLIKLNNKRIKIAEYYNKNITNKIIKKLIYKKGCVYHQYVIISFFKRKIIQLFEKNNIQYGEHYPIPINKLSFVKKFFKNEKYPNAENLAKYSLSLPIDPFLKSNDLKKICKILNSV